MIKKTMILTAILITLCSNLQAQQAELTRVDVIKLIAVANKKLNLSGVNLYGVNLSKLNLTGADLSGTDLSYANLSGANLTGADLNNANLINANLSSANLTNANLTGAILIYILTTGEEYQPSKTNFTGAILTGVIGYKKP